MSATLFVTLRDVQILRVRRGWGCHAKAAATWAAVDRQLTNNAAARHRTRYLAIYELTLEATRRPALAEVLSGMVAATLDVTIGQHRGSGWTPPRRRCRR